MKSAWKLIKIFCTEEDGVTSIEYALIAALIALVIFAAVGAVGDQLVILYNAVADGFPK